MRHEKSHWLREGFETKRYPCGVDGRLNGTDTLVNVTCKTCRKLILKAAANVIPPPFFRAPMVTVRAIVWFAKGGGIAKCGPFPTQIAATNALRLVKRGENYVRSYGIKEDNSIFPADVFVWPEEAP